MKLFIITYKVGWQVSQEEFVTLGGFPYQMKAISELFDQTTVTLLLRHLPLPGGMQTLGGYQVTVFPLPEPASTGFRRKINLLTWLPENFSEIRDQIRQADAVHAPVPGDIGFIGLILALIQRKNLFVRHCGTWGEPATFADRILLWLLERIAGGRNVVLATGGSSQSPSRKNPNIDWIFSTTLTDAELAQMPSAPLWSGNGPLRLVTVCRLSEGKNVQAIIRALARIPGHFPEITLHIAGDGEYRSTLEAQVREYHLQNRVVFHGNLSHEGVMELLAQSHLFVFPTRVKEGFPKAVLEAMAVGLPVIATGVSVIPHLIGNGGVVLSEPTPENIVQALEQLIAHPHRFTDMAAQSRLRAKDFTLERWRDAIGQKLQNAWGPLKSLDIHPE